MTSADYSFDLNEEMVQRIEQEFGPEALRRQLRAEQPDDRRAFFVGFGERWMKRTLELGEKHSDRTYDVLKQIVAKTGHYAFPFVGERFIEIAYLSTQPVFKLPVIENGAKGLVFSVPQCDFYSVIGEELGADTAALMDCAAGCLAACRLAFEGTGSRVSIESQAAMAVDGSCRFAVRPI